MLLLLGMCRGRAFPLPSFALGFLRRSLGLWLLLFVLKQLRKHLLKDVDRFLLSMNHIELLPLGLSLKLKRLAISSGVLAIYAKASFSTEDFEACDSAMAESNSLNSIP